MVVFAVVNLVLLILNFFVSMRAERGASEPAGREHAR